MSYFIERGPLDPDALSGAIVRGAVIRSRAPLRVSFCGGGTDLKEYASEHGGLVLSATIARYAYATLQPTADREIQVASLDYDLIERFHSDEPLIYDGKIDLIKACLRRLRVGPEAMSGMRLHLQTDAPPGSGLGASSALVVSLIGAFITWRRLTLTNYEIAELAYELERTDVGIAGGMQDQYAATFGGFNLMEFGDDRVIVTPLRVDKDVVRELEYNSMLVFTGGTRLSGHIIDEQIRGYVAQRNEVVESLHEMKRLATEARDALLLGRLGDLGRILDKQWWHKKRTSSAISNPHIDNLYAEAKRLGAVGGKMSGAGGGGYMFLICPFDRQPAVSARLRELGAETSPVRFEFKGVASWFARPLDASPALVGAGAHLN
ncbi:MAG: GHMP kinase [Candidatus Dormibacteraeota bacterium]|nr:GHMP kinase [Candidatus Dormibacteraeota bacterium]MBV9524791.1 GHMP kinase [Candidatus Dormibacteraeota bacterium]